MDDPSDNEEVAEIAALRAERDKYRDALRHVLEKMRAAMAHASVMLPDDVRNEFSEIDPAAMADLADVPLHRGGNTADLTARQERDSNTLATYRFQVESGLHEQKYKTTAAALAPGDKIDLEAQMFPHAVRNEVVDGPLAQFVFVSPKKFTLRVRTQQSSVDGPPRKVDNVLGELLPLLNSVAGTPLQSEIEFELLLLCGDATVDDLFHNRKLFSFVGPDGASTLTIPELGKITTTSGDQYSIFEPPEKRVTFQTPKNRWIGKWGGASIVFEGVSINAALKSKSVKSEDMKRFRFGVRCTHPGARGFRNLCQVSDAFFLHSHHLQRKKSLENGFKEPNDLPNKKRKKNSGEGEDAAEGAVGADPADDPAAEQAEGAEGADGA